MRHSDPTFFRGVFELLVAANLIDFVPAVFLQFLDHVPAIHHRPLIPRHNTHFLHTRQFVNTHSMRIIAVITPQKPPAAPATLCASPHRAVSEQRSIPAGSTTRPLLSIVPAIVDNRRGLPCPLRYPAGASTGSRRSAGPAARSLHPGASSESCSA